MCWRNAALDGALLRDDAVAALQQYALPSRGMLRLDYVSYQVCSMTHHLAEQQHPAGARVGGRDTSALVLPDDMYTSPESASVSSAGASNSGKGVSILLLCLRTACRSRFQAL